ncbi:UNVERIFIED_ORG: L,D-peptidoglycan transpeptidase YkuD (ErfK/YbiS/YcfS/YnhG family) [Rhizobium sp. SORGH_AS260]|uniref:L,D-transpeptidase family protein n=1 Tax=Agrobacterium TaxID=357 RepID=UPI001FCCCFC7|nr:MULTISPECIES: L,D-transpeptidase [Agrobacterium]MCJ2876963.1 L,D-transpeptidase [Agrobacterium pusense]MDP9734382.1 L,D-peptidoglycan transpeptidase YkuD (ErfK/YbiS/YcfS/YnhG family) [Rhizobium sp. SORGH_AS_0285]MDP9756487.1 L,D-peptidoglycan transpeptidase YkuD (ErfK/YbiS/YcfS/YnhG family) [Rhizobium sp. SORGH_AS_0260]MDR6083566.1 L,D-peptidoglycan transpeptidase YkuD (ErfK/YbiS/YcfS/YnhG family) [Agrobacterium sp. SORGH_AS_0440]
MVRPAPLKINRAIVQLGHLTFQAAIGRNGRTARKREGDGKSPISATRLLHGFYRGDRMSAITTALPMQRTRKSMLWCDEPGNPNYNRLVKAPFAPSHEDMMRTDGLYDVCLVLDWNVTSRSRNRGSAIFMHMIRPGCEPTAGCVALHPRDMRRVLPHLRKGTKIRIL